MVKHSANKVLTPVIIVFISLQLFTNAVSAQRVNIHKDYQVLEAENKVWLATPNGLFQYNSTNDSYKRFIVPENSNQAIRIMKYNDEWLWCVMDSSIAALHIRLNEWLVFDERRGLPSNHVTGIDFTDDYIYASTTNGAARYDLLIEEWESLNNDHLSGKPVNDVIVIEDKVWFITENEVSEYSPAYEKWRHFKIGSDPDLKVSIAYYYNSDIWLLSTEGLVQFNPELQSFQYHNNTFLLPGAMLEIYTETDNNWVITPDGLFSYNYESEMWSAFEANSYLKDKKIVNGYIDDSEIWIFTDRDVRVYDRSVKNWEVLDYASGLTSTAFQTGYISNGMAFLISDNSIEYRLTESGNWYQYEIKQGGRDGGAAAGKFLSNLFDNEEGGYIGIGKRNLSFEGSRITYINDVEKSFYDDGTLTDKTSGYRIDAKSQFSLSANRNISGYYNNIDYSETMYGIRYRSKEDGDLLREFNWGDYRSDPGEIPFGETASMFGSNIWLQTGKKTEKYKRSLLSLKAQTGQKRSQKHYQYIQGALDDFEMEIDDIDYIRNQFFKIPYSDTTQVVSNIEIYVDDLLSGNNSPNTGKQTIAGITGDFDLLEATSHYYYYQKANVIRFTGYYSATSTIVIRYQVGSQVYEGVLREGDISTSLNNFYNLQAQSIIPYSLELSIKTADGTDVPISAFGLDDDGDGRIDKEWIDYENGILIFPDETPFPDGVYDSENRVSSYVMDAKFSTEYSLVQLEYDNLVRGTEEVKLDGQPAEGGTDYVLDYTNGTMVFVQDGIVTPETRIEIEYEYYLEDDYSQMHTVTLNYSPSDNVLVQADYQNFEKDDGETANTVKLYSELRHRVGNTDIKITPAVVYDAEESKLTAYQVEGLVSSSKVRLQSKYQRYDEAYNNIYKPQSVVGQIKDNLELSTDLDVHQNVRLSGSYNDIRAFSASDATKELYDKNRTASALFHRSSLPGYEISYTNTQTRSDTSSINKSFIEQKLEYQLPQSVIDKLPIKGLKVEGFLKLGEQSGQEIAGTTDQKFLQSNFRVNMSLAEQFQASLFYRKNDFMDNSDSITGDKHVLTSERVLFSLSHERWKLLQTNIRVENTVDSYEYPADIQYNMDLSQYAQVNFRLSPAVIWDKLSSLFFEFNINQSLYAKANSEDGRGGYVWSFLPDETSELTNYQYLRNYYVKNEFRPTQNIYFYTLYEWNNQTTNYSLSQLHTNYRRLSEQFDAKIGFKTRLRLQYKHYFSDLGYDETLSYYEPSLWVERRWTSSFQNIFYVAYRRTKDFDGDIKDYTNKWDARYDIILRKKDYLRMDRLELQQTFSAGQVETSGYNIANYYTLGSSTSLNLYPLSSVIVRFQFNVNNTINTEESDLSYLTTGMNLRLSFKF